MQEKIKAELKQAMIAKDADRLMVLRSVLAAFTNELVAKGRKPTESLSDSEAIAVIKRATKQRHEAAREFTNGGRPELAEKEAAEAKMLGAFLPQTMSIEEIEKVVIAKKEALGISDKSGMGRLMGEVMKELRERANGEDVKTAVEKILS